MAAAFSHINFRHRLTQIVILVVSILACMLFSQMAFAKRMPKPPRFDKHKYRVCVHISSQRVVKILHKKRFDNSKATLMASNRRGHGTKAQAETAN